MAADSSRDKSGDTENCQAWLARPAPFRHVHPMDDSNGRSTEATFTGGGKPVSLRVASRDFDFCQPPGTSTAQAAAHDLPVGIAPGCSDHRTSAFSSGARSIRQPGVVELYRSCSPGPLISRSSDSTACIPLPRASLDAARTSFEPVLNDLVSVLGFVSRPPKQTDSATPGQCQVRSIRPFLCGASRRRRDPRRMDRQQAPIHDPRQSPVFPSLPSNDSSREPRLRTVPKSLVGAEPPVHSGGKPK